VPRVSRVSRVPRVARVLGVFGVLGIMDNKEFGKRLEERTRKFAVRIIRLSTNYRTLLREGLLETRSRNAGLLLGQIIEKPIAPEVKRISEIRLRFVKVKPVKPFIG
jgi:hypothetical protein